jgi:hypothetical protein
VNQFQDGAWLRPNETRLPGEALTSAIRARSSMSPSREFPPPPLSPDPAFQRREPDRSALPAELGFTPLDGDTIWCLNGYPDIGGSYQYFDAFGWPG